jgi:hypothetical protein
MHGIIKIRRRLAGALAAAAALSAAPATQGQLLSGFEGDLSSTLGVDWAVVGSLPAAEFVPALTEGAQAVQIANDPVNGSWPAFELAGSTALAELIVNSRALALDWAPNDGFSWRQLFPILNSSNGWKQAGQIDFVPGNPFQETVIDLNSAIGDTTYRRHAQQWLDAPGAWFNLNIVIQGAQFVPEETPFTIFDNIRFYAAADFDLSGAVDQTDLGIWEDATGAEGDADGDGDSDGADFLFWQRQADFPVALTSAVPEPASAALATIVLLAGLGQRCRQPRS